MNELVTQAWVREFRRASAICQQGLMSTLPESFYETEARTEDTLVDGIGFHNPIVKRGFCLATKRDWITDPEGDYPPAFGYQGSRI